MTALGNGGGTERKGLESGGVDETAGGGWLRILGSPLNPGGLIDFRMESTVRPYF